MKNIPMKNILFKLSIIPTALLLLAFCGETPPVPEETASVESREEAESWEPAEPRTEEELRQAIGQAEDDKEGLETKRKYYELLLAMDVFTEADYAALARVYADQGEWALQREMLSKVLRLYPSREYAEQLSAIVIQEDGTDEGMAALAGRIMEAFELHSGGVMRELTGLDEWKAAAAEGMTGIETRTRYCQGEDVLQITADGAYTEITWKKADGGFYFYRGDETGSVLGETQLTEGVYHGETVVIYSDPEGNEVRTYSAVLDNNICTEQIVVTFDGKEYTGKLNADGTTAEEQYKKAADAGGVVYAYTGDGKSYLYQENESPETFRMDAAYLGFPEYTEWR